jgi:DHA3 family tetracycline resistance protein-like MFS transporter
VRRLSAVAAYLLLVELGLSLSFAVAFTVSAVYFVETVGMNPLELVLVGTVMEAAVFLFEVPTGVVADTYGRKRSIVLGWLVMGSGLVLAGAVHEVWAVLAGWVIWGIGWTFMSGAYQAWITDEVGADRVGPVFARGDRLGYVGALVGAGLSVLLAATFSTSVAVVTGGVLTAALAVVGLAAMPETGWQRRAPGSRASLAELRSTAVVGGRLVRARPVLLLILAITFFAGMSTESFDRLWQAHLLEDVGLPAVGSLDPIYWFGIFEACTLGIGFVVATFLVRKLHGLGAERLARMLLVVTVVQLAAALVFGLAVGLAMAAVGYFGYRAARSFASPVYDTWLNQNVPDSSVRATVISITNQSDAIGQVAGGPALGAIGTVFSIRAALVSGALVLLPAIGLFGRALAHHGKEPELEELPAS